MTRILGIFKTVRTRPTVSTTTTIITTTTARAITSKNSFSPVTNAYSFPLLTHPLIIYFFFLTILLTLCLCLSLSLSLSLSCYLLFFSPYVRCYLNMFTTIWMSCPNAAKILSINSVTLTSSLLHNTVSEHGNNYAFILTWRPPSATVTYYGYCNNEYSNGNIFEKFTFSTKNFIHSPLFHPMGFHL